MRRNEVIRRMRAGAASASSGFGDSGVREKSRGQIDDLIRVLCTLGKYGATYDGHISSVCVVKFKFSSWYRISMIARVCVLGFC